MARQGTYTVTFTFDGNRYYAYGKTKEEADKNASVKRALLEANVFSFKTTNVTVRQWSYKWLEDYKDGAVSYAWYKQTKGILENHILPEIGDKNIRQVKASDIQRMMNKKSHFSESHQRKIAQITTQIFDSAQENDLIDKLPIKRIKTSVKCEKSRTRAITDEERALTLAVADKHPKEGLFFLIMLYCGLRPAEVSRLLMSDYDKKNKILHIRRARKADGSVGSPKSASGTRDVPVPSYLAVRLDNIKKKNNELICTSATGRPLTKTTQKRMWNRFKRYMDIENGACVFRGAIVQTTLADDLHPYCYRHTFCTDLQDAGVPITVAQRLMGHSDIKITAQIYTHSTDKSFEDAREKINLFHNKCG